LSKTDPLEVTHLTVDRPEVVEAVRESAPRDKILVVFLSATNVIPRPHYPLMLPIEDPTWRAKILVFGEYSNEIRQKLAKVVAPLIPEGYRFDFWYWVDTEVRSIGDE
jgi:hypothetical protein